VRTACQTAPLIHTGSHRGILECQTKLSHCRSHSRCPQCTSLELRLCAEAPTGTDANVLRLIVRLVFVACLIFKFSPNPDIAILRLALHPIGETHVRTAAHLVESVIRSKEPIPFRAVVTALSTHNIMSIWPASGLISGCGRHDRPGRLG